MKATAIAAVLVSLAGVAHAAPIAPKPSSEPLAEQVACAWVGGARVCDGRRYVNRRHYRHAPYGAYPNNGPPEAYRTGSTDWWRAMDRECRGGFRCR